MRPYGALLAGVLALVAPRSASAAPPSIAAAETAVRLGLSAGYGTYAGNIPHEENGALLGAEFGASLLTPMTGRTPGGLDLYASVNYEFSAQFLQHDGSRGDATGAPYPAHENGYYNHAEVRLGLGHAVYDGAEIIPYAAAGYQNWYRDTGGAAGYGHFYQAGMIGGGLKLDVVATPLLVVSADAEGFALLGGMVTAPSQNFPGGLGASAEERVSLDADYRLNNAWHVFAGLGVTHYNETGSKPSDVGGYEPMSTTLDVNSLLGLSYGF